MRITPLQEPIEDLMMENSDAQWAEWELAWDEIHEQYNCGEQISGNLEQGIPYWIEFPRFSTFMWVRKDGEVMCLYGNIEKIMPEQDADRIIHEMLAENNHMDDIMEFILL